MNLGKHTINLIGTIVVGVILLAGLLLGALPLYNEANENKDEASRIQQQNAIQRHQVTLLASKEAERAQIESKVQALQEQIASDANLDGIIRVVTAADAADSVQLRKIEPGAITPFTPATAPVEGEEKKAAAGAATGDADDAEPAALEQIPLTIEAGTKNVADAIAFLDDLRKGPRLMSNVQSVITRTGDEKYPFTVTVTGFTFVSPAV